MQLRSQATVKVWKQSCFDCAVTRGWTPAKIMEDLRISHGYGVSPSDFKCVHRTDLAGREHICAAMQKLVDTWTEPPKRELKLTFMDSQKPGSTYW